MIESKDLAAVWDMIGLDGECPYDSLREFEKDPLERLSKDNHLRLRALLKLAEQLSGKGRGNE